MSARVPVFQRSAESRPEPSRPKRAKLNVKRGVILTVAVIVWPRRSSGGVRRTGIGSTPVAPVTSTSTATSTPTRPLRRPSSRYEPGVV